MLLHGTVNSTLHPPNRRRWGIAGLIALAAIACLALAALRPGQGSAQSGAAGVRFEESPMSPFELGGSPVGLLAGDYFSGDGLDDLVIPDRTRRRLVMYRRGDTGLSPVLRAGAPVNAAAIAASRGNFALAGSEELWLYRFRAPRLKPTTLRVVERLPFGGQPTDVAFADFLIGNGLGSGLVATDRATDSLRVFNLGKDVSELPPVAVGDDPSAVAVASFGRPVAVANAGSDTVTVLASYVGEGVSSGGDPSEPIPPYTAFRAKTFPVGDSPEALALGNLDTDDVDDVEIVIANAGSRTLTVLNSPDDTDDYSTSATVSVPGRPSAVTIAPLDGRRGLDVAVTTAEGRLVVYSGDRRGNLRQTGIYRTGSGPSEIVALSANRYFSPDLAVLNERSRDVTILLRRQPGECNGRPARLVMGTSQDEFLRGVGGPDLLIGRAGDDELNGNGADDCIRGGIGDDLIEGGDGADEMIGGAGADRVLGSAGNDVISGGPGDDQLFSDAGSPYGRSVEGLSGKDVVAGGSGNDRIVGGFNPDRIKAGTGDDRISAFDRSSDVVDCGPGRDRVVANRRDVLEGCERVIRY